MSYTLEHAFPGYTARNHGGAIGRSRYRPFGSSSFAIAVQNAGLNDLKIIADEVQDGVPGWGGPEFRVLKDGPIKTIDDLRGKVLVTNIFGGETDIAIKLTMLKHNMLANRDYTEIQAEMANMNSLLLSTKPISSMPFIRSRTMPISEHSRVYFSGLRIRWASSSSLS